jgi:hypothetical protein
MRRGTYRDGGQPSERQVSMKNSGKAGALCSPGWPELLQHKAVRVLMSTRGRRERDTGRTLMGTRIGSMAGREMEARPISIRPGHRRSDAQQRTSSAQHVKTNTEGSRGSETHQRDVVPVPRQVEVFLQTLQSCEAYTASVTPSSRGKG